MSYEELKQRLKELQRLGKVSNPLTEDERVNWAAGQCALADREGRSLEWWIETTRRALKNIEIVRREFEKPNR